MFDTQSLFCLRKTVECSDHPYDKIYLKYLISMHSAQQ